MCNQLGLELLAQLPLDPRLGQALDEGKGDYFERFADSPVSKQFEQLVSKLMEKCTASMAIEEDGTSNGCEEKNE
jgi:Flp pilus assembly CpaE family ATPase